MHVHTYTHTHSGIISGRFNAEMSWNYTRRHTHTYTHKRELEENQWTWSANCCPGSDYTNLNSAGFSVLFLSSHAGYGDLIKTNRLFGVRIFQHNDKDGERGGEKRTGYCSVKLESGQNIGHTHTQKQTMLYSKRIYS